MKVGYFIFTMDQGVGGHYYTLQAIQKVAPAAKTIVIGYTQPQISFLNQTFIPLKELGFFKALKVISSIVDDVDILHAFDEHSYLFARIISCFKNKKLILTKCGGKAPRYHPLAKREIFISREDYEFYSGKRKSLICWYIPNRVDVPSIINGTRDPGGYFSKFSQSQVNIICIARVGVKYKSKLSSSIKLAANLRRKGIDCVLIIIGVCESTAVLNEMQEYARFCEVEKHCIFLNDEEYTYNAVRFVPYADLVVGTGRGAMEAMCLGVPTVCLVNKSTPVLVREDNLQLLFDRNFSERVSYSVDNESELSYIEETLLSSDALESLKKYYNDVAKASFSTECVSEKYIEAYRAATTERGWMAFDWVVNYFYILYIKRVKLRD